MIVDYSSNFACVDLLWIEIKLVDLELNGNKRRKLRVGLDTVKHPARRSGGAQCAPPAGSGTEPQPKLNLVHLALKYDIWWQQT